MENKLLTFIRPYLSFIDNGHFFRKPFSWLYTLLAIVNLLIPIYVFYQASDNRIFDEPAKFVIVFLLLWVIVAFAGWVGFQLWWDRKSKIDMSSTAGDEFIATPALSHFIQTLGEWIGIWICTFDNNHFRRRRILSWWKSWYSLLEYRMDGYIDNAYRWFFNYRVFKIFS